MKSSILGKLIIYFASNHRGDVIDDISSFIEEEVSSEEQGSSAPIDKIHQFVERYCDNAGSDVDSD